MEINKKQISLLLVMTMVVFSLSLVSSALTLNKPSASSNIGGISPFNVTVPGPDNGNVNFTCILYGKSSLTANSTWTSLVTSANNTAGWGASNFTNSSFNSAGLEDANNYQFNATCFNDSGIFGDVIVTSVRVDNTVPTASTSLTPTSDGDGSVTFSGTVTGRETTSCTLQFNGALAPGGNGQAMTHTGSTCSLTINSVPESVYTWFIRASDETNTTDSSSQQTNVDIKTSSGKAAILASQKGVTPLGGSEFLATSTEGFLDGNGTTVIVVLVLVGLVIVALVRRK